MLSTDLRQTWLDVMKKWQFNSKRPANTYYWSPELETCSREEIRQIQSEKLVTAVKYMYENTPLYCKKYDALGIRPEDIRGVEDLPKLPIISKQDMSTDLDLNAPFGTYTPTTDQLWQEHGWMLFNTSGTTSEPRIFRYTQFDREMWTWTDARALYSMGIRSLQDSAMLMFGYGPHVAMWGMHYALHLMNVPIIPAGGLDTRVRASAIVRYRPTVLAATPSYALYLASIMKEMAFDPAASSVKRIICLGEPLPDSTADRIRNIWNVEIHQFYGCTEAAPSCGGYTCEYGMHFMEDTHILETVDPETFEPVPEGTPGITVVTNLCSEASPQIRFLVGDYTTLEYAPCECGRTHVRALGGFSGRADDMLNIRGVTLFPSTIENLVRQFHEFGEEFEIVLTRRNELDEFTVVVEILPSISQDLHPSLVYKLESAIRADCELRPIIKVKPYGTLPKTQFKGKRVRDLR